MLSVMLIWVYILVTTYVVGFGLCLLSERTTGYRSNDPISIFFAGILGVTVYAQIYSLFGGVGFGANLGLLILCMTLILFFYSDMKQTVLMQYAGCGNSKKIAIVILFLVMAYGASRGYIHYDTSLYHAQSIHWIETYGVVKGLGNLHCRLAYNSASFALSALYSFHYFGGQSYHTCAGFLAFLVGVESLKLGEVILPHTTRRNIRVSDLVRLMAVYYLLIIFDEMVSPASDYFMVLSAFYLMIRWLSLREENCEEPEPYSLLCVFGVFLLTVKLSAALILLLVVVPARKLLLEKKGREILFYLGAGLFTAFPYFARNVILSGWLVYPFTAIDLFDVPWKIPKGIADSDSHEIQVWGRGYTDVTRYHIPIREWIGDWFGAQSSLDKLFILTAFAGCIFVAFLLLLRLVRCLVWRNGKTEGNQMKSLWNRLLDGQDILVEKTVICACFLFWLFTSPLMRYGCVYVWLAVVLVWGDLLITLTRLRVGWQVALLMLMGVTLLYKGAAFGKEVLTSFQNDYWVCQEDYENYPVTGVKFDDIMIFIPTDGDRTGYDAFPSAPDDQGFRLAGSTLRDGFLPDDQ